MRRLLVVATALAAACLPRAQVTILDAADVPLPDEVQRLAVVHGDPGGSAAGRVAVEAAAEALQRGVGLSAVQAPVPGAWPEGPLPVEAILATCEASGVSAVVVLDALDTSSDLAIHTEEPVAAEEESVPVIRAERSATVRTSWRTVGCDGQVLDEMVAVDTTDRWSSEAAEEGEAEAGVPDAEASILELARSAGLAYGQRIAPTWLLVTRDYFATGDRRLRAAALRVRAADWDGAMELWTRVAQQHPDPAIRARALYDLALAWEVRGEEALAMRNAERAVSEHDSRRARRYLEVLRERRIDTRPLRASTTDEEESEER